MSTPIERILDLARWAPSGDNTQPWRFEIVSDNHFIVHGSDTRDWCVYDLEGRASQIAIGALLETIGIAATGEGLIAEFSIRESAPETAPEIDVSLYPPDGFSEMSTDPLLPFIKKRVTQRRALKTDKLEDGDRERLATSMGSRYSVKWVDGVDGKSDMARLLFKNAHIRLTIPEAYEVHRRIIEWGARYSEDRIPDQAIGLDSVNLRLMRWAMQSWGRIAFLNRYLAGTLLPRLILDYLPGKRCAAHFFIVAEDEPRTLADYLAGGRALQRFWLTAAGLGIQLQPEMTPLIFSTYVRHGREFTHNKRARGAAQRLRSRLAELIEEQVLSSSVFMGRVGYGSPPEARSVRLPLDRLMVEAGGEQRDTA